MNRFGAPDLIVAARSALLDVLNAPEVDGIATNEKVVANLEESLPLVRQLLRRHVLERRHLRDEDGDHDWFDGLVHGHPDWPPIWQFEGQRLASAVVHGEVVLLVFRTRRGREKLEQVVRIDEEDGRITRLRDYGFCPDTTAALGRALDLPFRRGPYRYPTEGK
jgi:hypothetical protein